MLLKRVLPALVNDILRHGPVSRSYSFIPTAAAALLDRRLGRVRFALTQGCCFYLNRQIGYPKAFLLSCRFTFTGRPGRLPIRISQVHLGGVEILLVNYVHLYKKT